MIINSEREPTLSLYYLGSVVLNILCEYKSCEIVQLYDSTKKVLAEDIHIDFFYYTLDWLFIISAIKLEEERVFLCVLKD
ncbi:MAG: hypothetical protein E7569_12430 [Ruminococcaceae bacterium]|nr:hypothetical protein [Oscillospiraceae bacterium]